MTNTIDLIQKQVVKISELKNLPSSEAPEFKKWRQVTLSVLENRLGKIKADNFPSDFEFWPNRVGPWEPAELKEYLLKGLDSAEAYLSGLVEELEILGEEKSNIQRPMPSSKDYPKLMFGESGKEGKAGSGGSVFIQATNFINKGGVISADGGDYVISSQDLNNYGTINRNIAETITNISKLSSRINESDISEEDKLQLIGDAETIKAQIIKPKPDKTILEKAWSAVQAASTIGGVAELIKLIAPVVLRFLK